MPQSSLFTRCRKTDERTNLVDRAEVALGKSPSVLGSKRRETKAGKGRRGQGGSRLGVVVVVEESEREAEEEGSNLIIHHMLRSLYCVPAHAP